MQLKCSHSEFDLVKSLDHPNIIKYWELFESGEKIYLVMDLGGASLDSLIECERERLTPHLIRSIVRQLLTAVAYLKERSVSHHDIKTANLLIDDQEHVILCDFGVAERYDKSCGCQCFFGTPTYQAPEIAGNVSGATFDGAKADIWSAGVLLYSFIISRLAYFPVDIFW
jgi:serine/threonine protein kinase